MGVRVSNFTIGLLEHNNLREIVSSKLGIKINNENDIKIIKESIDARKKNDIKLNYILEIYCGNDSSILKRAKSLKLNANIIEKEEIKPLVKGNIELKNKVIVVGMGPSGIFAGLLLAREGYKPLIIEQGEAVEEREKTVLEFWKTGKLNPKSNVQFGEGGAGTFSDGKLTTRIKDPRCTLILDELVKAGAPKEISYVGKPHIGTDILKDVVKNIREEIISLGGEVRFNSKLEDIIIENNNLKAAIINGEEVQCEKLILAIGHSSRDTYEMLYNRGMNMTPKAFAIGVRVEHPQGFIDESQYGEFASHPKLKAADYRLAYTSEEKKRAVYSFCMCPGGVVVPSSSEDNRLVVNGMSYYARDLENANAAMVVTVSPDDFDDKTPLGGIKFQRHYEELAFKLGGSDYKAPVQLVGDFLQDRVSKSIGKVIPSYSRGYVFEDLRKCLPEYVTDMLKEGFSVFNNKIKGYAMEDAVLTGIETRTSAPVRLERDEKLQSISINGIYPCGEGAGFAGGIISAAVDGLKVAEKIIGEYYYI